MTVKNKSSSSRATSRCLARLESQIKQATGTSPSWQTDCYRAERAAYLARLGHLDEAQSELDSVQLAQQIKPQSQVSIWLNLAQGILWFYKDMDEAATDKFRRAHALSVATGWAPLRALSASWLAHGALLQLDVPTLVMHLKEAFTAAADDDHRARSRACLITAQAWDTAGLREIAKPWYERAHAHAVQEGDDTLMSALIHNRAWLEASHWRQAFWMQSSPKAADAGAGTAAWLAAGSVQNFDRLVGTTSLSALSEVLRAQLLALRGQAQAALQLYEQHLDAAVAQGMQRHHANLLADQAWCRVQLGQADAALADVKAAQTLIKPKTDHDDDCACAHSRLAGVWQALGDVENAKLHTEQASAAWARHVAFQNRLAQALTAIE
jgi:tetratricopeptide (TPR) repeat protein